MLWLQVIVMTFVAAALVVTAGPLSQSLSNLYSDMTLPATGSGAGADEGSSTDAAAEASGTSRAARDARPWTAASRMVAFAASLAMVEAERAAAQPPP